MRITAITLGALVAGACACVFVAARTSASPAKHRPSATASASASSTATSEVTLATARERYGARRGALEMDRKALAARLDADPEARADVLGAARPRLLDAFEDDLFPAWIGTAWDFNGTSQEPGKGSIACGYFVTTLLAHAGFEVQRAKLAQQASENIVKTLAGADDIWRFRKGDAALVLAKVRELGDGLYVVGLDNHAGFLFEHDGRATRFCHSSYLEPATVQCEDAAGAAALESNYHVLGRVTNDATITRWLRGDAFETHVSR
ncbi:MAG: hypothetical protein U0414_08770 [Polyangiaceae bacterium]